MKWDVGDKYTVITKHFTVKKKSWLMDCVMYIYIHYLHFCCRCFFCFSHYSNRSIGSIPDVVLSSVIVVVRCVLNPLESQMSSFLQTSWMFLPLFLFSITSIHVGECSCKPLVNCRDIWYAHILNRGVLSHREFDFLLSSSAHHNSTILYKFIHIAKLFF